LKLLPHKAHIDGRRGKGEGGAGKEPVVWKQRHSPVGGNAGQKNFVMGKNKSKGKITSPLAVGGVYREQGISHKGGGG